MIAVVALGGVASAQPKQSAPALVGASEAAKFSAATGFVDDPVATDDARVAYVLADASTKAELHVATLGGGEQVVDIASVTLHPIALKLVGPRAFVVGQLPDGNEIAAMVELAAVGKKPAGTVVYKLGPATHITAIRDGAKNLVAVHKMSPGKDGGTHHELSLVGLETGKAVGGAKSIDFDAKDFNAKVDFHVDHWSDGYRFAWGLKGGEWDKKENQRSPDVEAKLDLSTGKIVWTQPIGDLFEQRKRFQTLAEVHDAIDFLRMSWDNQNIQIWHAGKPVTVALDEPITNYDPKSLQGVVDADGSAWLALKTDPVNPDAVARKKADPEYLDVFRVSADGKASRKARVLSPSMRFRFGVLGTDKFWLLERSNGFDRGGKTLTVYKLGA
ncbi:MAG: hypothetical protein JO257_17640 [Deltaproteobacteria bacterium]|nr:hypothetical protein [Deltaproteobacteria bacterium]